MPCLIKFDVRTHTWVTREGNPDDEWDNDSTDGSVNIYSATLVDRDSYDTLPCKDDVKVGDIVFLVYAVYGTGDSFGSYGGKYELLTVHKDAEEAEKSREHYKTVNDYSVPWTGYFEWLQDIHVESFMVRGT